ncbi:thiamine phosphate synthase [Acuticoccus kandeliae]|uniref:thiamine phosphate synthase n=1 Tax=Acuticoccus kandeliae TaxID=2073160 RepID=UPI0013003444|nr:thiamine phosphate synthase [Acuticoccus kandeliae]
MRPRLILVAPPDLTSDRLRAALSGGDVAALVLPTGAAHLRALIATAQQEGAAALLDYELATGGASPWPLAYGADGVHVHGDFKACVAAVGSRPEGATIGAATNSRHDAMSLGETGADYLWFGDLQRLDEDALELAIWWQALFEVPAVAAGPCDAAAIEFMIATRVEFIAVNVFSSADDPGEWVARINGLLDQGVTAS